MQYIQILRRQEPQSLAAAQDVPIESRIAHRNAGSSSRFDGMGDQQLPLLDRPVSCSSICPGACAQLKRSTASNLGRLVASSRVVGSHERHKFSCSGGVAGQQFSSRFQAAVTSGPAISNSGTVKCPDLSPSSLSRRRKRKEFKGFFCLVSCKTFQVVTYLEKKKLG